MNKKEIVKELLKHRILLPPKMLDKINENNIEDFLNKAKETEKPTETKEIGIKAAVREANQKQRMSTRDFIDYYNNRYNGIRNILTKKMRAVSVSNAKKSFSDVSIIGMVREATPPGLVLEDPTGEIDVILKDKKGINPDDVIGIRGFIRENRLFAREIIFPDTPLTHPIGSIDASILLIPTITEKTKEAMEEADLVFTLKNNPNTSNKTIKPDSNPCWITLSKNKKEVNLLIYKPENQTTIKQAIVFLKKRHLPTPKNKITGPDDPFLIEPVPDIFWLVSDEKGAETYKGVTIISCGPNCAARINLKTRKVEFI
jgi:DNA polymerase II small subunit/DNA polymerase delta subunit B